MYCNNCGKDNSEGTKFCTMCGTPLVTEPQNEQPVVNSAYDYSGDNTMEYSVGDTAQKNIYGLSRGLKSLILMGVVAFMILIAVIQILLVNSSVTSIKKENEEIFSVQSGSSPVDTDRYIYFTYINELYRGDKKTGDVEKISKKETRFLSTSGSKVYVQQSNGKVYEISDKKDELKNILKLGSDVFVDGKYFYNVDVDGTIRKGICSDKNRNTYKIYNSRADYANFKKLYKGYMYMIEENYKKGEYEFVRVSLSNGKKEILSDEAVENYWITGDKIIYVQDSEYMQMNLNGKKTEEIDIDKDDFGITYVYDGFAYGYDRDKGEYCKVDLKDYSSEEIDIDGITYIVSDGILYSYGDTLTYYDFNGEEIQKFEIDG